MPKRKAAKRTRPAERSRPVESSVAKPFAGAAKNGSRLTPEVIEQIHRVLPTVLYLETAADFIGVSRSTMRAWFKRGRAEQLRLAEPKARPKASEALYLEFAVAYQRGLAEAESQASQTIQREAADGQWRAAAWLLERRSPERWSDKRRDKREGRRDGQEGDAERFAARLRDNPAAAELAGRLFELLVVGAGDPGGAGAGRESGALVAGPAPDASDESSAGCDRRAGASADGADAAAAR